MCAFFHSEQNELIKSVRKFKFQNFLFSKWLGCKKPNVFNFNALPYFFSSWHFSKWNLWYRLWCSLMNTKYFRNLYTRTLLSIVRNLGKERSVISYVCNSSAVFLTLSTVNVQEVSVAVVEDEVVAEEDQEEAVEVVEEEVEVRCRHIRRVHLSEGQLFCCQLSCFTWNLFWLGYSSSRLEFAKRLKLYIEIFLMALSGCWLIKL